MIIRDVVIVKKQQKYQILSFLKIIFMLMKNKPILKYFITQILVKYIINTAIRK